MVTTSITVTCMRRCESGRGWGDGGDAVPAQHGSADGGQPSAAAVPM